MFFCGMLLLQSFESSHKKYFERERTHKAAVQNTNVRQSSFSHFAKAVVSINK